jgi:hypothetical protein
MNLPLAFHATCNRLNHPPTDHCLWVNVAEQSLTHFHADGNPSFTISTSIHGTGQEMDSFKTPLGLHLVAEKIGKGEPVGTIFRGRKPVGTRGKDNPEALITNRIFWLDGLEPGLNQGGSVDSYQRFIYIHGVGDESRLGQPDSQGCIHLGAEDLLPLFKQVPTGTLVFISEN